MSTMMPEDLMAMLSQGQQPQGGGGGGLPPDLMGMLGGGGGAPAAEAPPLHGGEGSGDSDGAIRDAINSLQMAAQASTDEQDNKVILTCITNLQGILAQNQSNSDSLLQGKATPQAVRKASAGY